jgi:hypothetical protein
MKESDFKIIKKTDGLGDTWYHIKYRVTLFGITLFWKYERDDRHGDKTYFYTVNQCKYYIETELEDHVRYTKRQSVKTETIKL